MVQKKYSIIGDYIGFPKQLQGKVIPLNEGLAVDAAIFGVEYNLPLADSIIYATARRHEAILWTQDADFRNLTNVRYFPG